MRLSESKTVRVIGGAIFGLWAVSVGLDMFSTTWTTPPELTQIMTLMVGSIMGVIAKELATSKDDKKGSDDDE